MPATHSKYDIALSDAEIAARLRELDDVERGALEPASRAAMESHVRSYTMFCRSVRRPAFPVTFETLGLFFIQYCKWFGNTARSLPTVMSHIKRENRAHGPWLDDDAAFRIHDVITTLRKTDPVPSKQKLPCTHDVLNRVQRVAQLRHHGDFQHISMSRVAHDALLRGIELTLLRIGNIKWSPDRTRVTIAIHYSKAHKQVAQPEWVTIVDYGPSSGVAWLRRYWNVMQLDTRPPAYPLWPLVDKHGNIQWSTPTPKPTFISRARALLSVAGYPAHRYSGHSYRSGGATDLWESHKCRPLTIKLHGRWRSDAWRLYVRDNPHERAEEVARALAFFDQAGSDTAGGPRAPHRT